MDKTVPIRIKGRRAEKGALWSESFRRSAGEEKD